MLTPTPRPLFKSLGEEAGEASGLGRQSSLLTALPPLLGRVRADMAYLPLPPQAL